jgi:hypothetical protein
MTSNRKINVFRIAHFIVTMIIMLAVSLFIESCKKNENQETGSNDEEVQYSPNRQNVQQLLAIAVNKSFENNRKQQSLTKSSVSDITPHKLAAEADNPILHISYPYDYIKIHNVFKFSCAGVESPIVQAICGDGEIEVFIANFELFNENEADMNQSTFETEEPVLANIIIGEPMIVFKSDLGIYSCISNGGAMIDIPIAPSDYYTVFSSHKYLSDKALEKNLAYPIYQFVVKLTGDKVTLETAGADDERITTVYADEILLYNQQAVSAQELFNLVELSTNIPDISLQCEVTGLFENYFTVKTDENSNIEIVYYDEYTGFLSEDKGITPADIHVGDVINVTFSKLYESYNPKSIIANQIFY